MPLTKPHEKDEEEANAPMKTAKKRQRSEAKDDNENNDDDDTKSIGTTSTPSPPPQTPAAEVRGRRFSERLHRKTVRGQAEQLQYWQCHVGEEAGGGGQRRNANASAITNTTRKRAAATELLPTAKAVPTPSSTINKITPPFATAVPPPSEKRLRLQTFQQIADDFGLRLTALCEQYFFSLLTNASVCLVLTIDPRQQMAKISYEKALGCGALFSQPVELFSFVWPLTDWHQFLWGVRGIFLLFFVGCPRIRMEKRLAIQNANGGTQMMAKETSSAPIVEEPPDEDENGHGNKHTEEEEASGTSNDTFSVTVSHPDLRLERIAGDLLLRLVIVPGKHIQLSPHEQQHTKNRTKQKGDECLTFEDFKVANDDRGWIRVIEGGGVRKNGQRKATRTENWLKICRELFTYAIIGKSAAVFQEIFPRGTNGGRAQNNSRQIT
ncbi:hypothetical protein niasHT_008857 [Heterodera trifolii]|uniref:Uncharacterized protein n=1 Tax=Heterodera trifolii TaxID=157864 RepID=A0ABD2M135_9BILA